MEACRRGWEWLGFRVPCREVVIGLTLEAVEPLRVGVGRAEVPYSPSDWPLYRTRVCRGGACEEVPAIPGSSLKGALRTASAMLVLSCGVRAAHSGVGRDNCVHALFEDAGVFDKLRERASATGDTSALKQVLRGFCPTCLLYGAPGLAARLRISEFPAVPGTVRVTVKVGVAINRRTGASAGRLLYDVECVEAGTRFSGELRALNAPNWMLALLAASLLAVHQGFIKLGGFKSRGMGRVRIVVDDGTPVVRLRPGRLEPLDDELDNEEALPDGCVCEDGEAVCSGRSAMELLERLAEAWASRYCGALAKAYPKRLENAQLAAEEYGG